MAVTGQRVYRDEHYLLSVKKSQARSGPKEVLLPMLLIAHRLFQRWLDGKRPFRLVHALTRLDSNQQPAYQKVGLNAPSRTTWSNSSLPELLRSTPLRRGSDYRRRRRN